MKHQSARFSVDEFSDCIRAAEGLPLIGGQAVAWWARRYLDNSDQALTSRDLDFWADREEMEAFLKRIGAKPKYPHQYEMTVLAGTASLTVNGKPAMIEFLHTIPGLDVANPDEASVLQEFQGARISVLDPVSLILTKLHALRNFDQKDRQDLLHLKSCLRTARPFVAEALERDVELGLWYCERLIDCAAQKRNRRVGQRHRLNLLSPIPIETMKRLSRDAASKADRERLTRFLTLRWPKVCPDDGSC